MRLALFVLATLLLSFSLDGSDLFEISSGSAHFLSNAPMEIIEAKSEEIQGFLRSTDQTFAFKIDISTFQGFNSELQRQHFNEHYMETEEFPDARFLGKVIEKIDFAKNGTYNVRAKGNLTIHGITHERIINCEIQVDDDRITSSSNFSVLLEDHDITVPKIVFQKIAEEIHIKVEVVFQKG